MKSWIGIHITAFLSYSQAGRHIYLSLYLFCTACILSGTFTFCESQLGGKIMFR